MGCRFYVSPFLCLQLGTFGQCSEKAMAPHSSTLAWKIPWMEEPSGLQSMGSLRVKRLSDFTFTFTFHFHALEKEMASHSSVLAWRIPGTGEPGGLPPTESHRVGHDWSDLAAAAATYKTIQGDPDRRNTHSPRPRTISRKGQLENGCCSAGQERNREAYVQADPINPDHWDPTDHH